jgi:hypothetical protein
MRPYGSRFGIPTLEILRQKRIYGFRAQEACSHQKKHVQKQLDGQD